MIDLRTLADEWHDAIVELADEHDAAIEAVEVDPRWPRLSRAYQQNLVEADFAKEDPEVDATELCEELGIDADPDSLAWWGDNYECTLIPEDEFEDYAQELAEDIGAVNSNADWPACHIDWEAAANALKMDYTSVTYNGTDYLIRSC